MIKQVYSSNKSCFSWPHHMDVECVCLVGFMNAITMQNILPLHILHYLHLVIHIWYYSSHHFDAFAFVMIDLIWPYWSIMHMCVFPYTTVHFNTPI